MTAGELIRVDPKVIRRDEDLMRLFIELYEAHFSYVPSCTGCTFNNDFRKLKNKILNKNIMAKSKGKYTVKREHYNTIFRFKNKAGKIERRYGKDFDDEFAEGYLANSKDKNKKLIFENLEEPKKATPKKKATKKKSAPKKKEETKKD